MGSRTQPAWGVSLTAMVETAGAVVSHWKVANPLAPVVVVALAPDAPAGTTQAAGVGATVASRVQPCPGWRSSTSGSALWSSSLRTVTDGAHSWKAALRSDACSSAKSGCR